MNLFSRLLVLLCLSLGLSCAHANVCTIEMGASPIRRLSLPEALSQCKSVQGRLGGLETKQIDEVSELADHIVKNELRSDEGIPMEYVELLFAIQQTNFGFFKKLYLAKNADVSRSVVSACQKIRETLEGAPDAFEKLLEKPIITEHSSFRYLLARDYKTFDLERHSTLHPFGKNAESDGFKKAPHEQINLWDRNADSNYLPPGGHLIGLETRLTMYTPAGMRWIEGTVLGSMNKDWEIILLREKNTGEEISVSARDDRGQLNRYYVIPRKSASFEEFEEKFGHYVPITTSLNTLTTMRESAGNLAFLVNFQTHTQILVGKGSIHGGEGNRYSVSVKATDGIVYSFKYKMLMSYTMKPIPDDAI